MVSSSYRLGARTLQISVALKVPLSGYQALIYSWIQTTNTKRLPPEEQTGEGRRLGFAACRNRVMELRKVLHGCWRGTVPLWCHLTGPSSQHVTGLIRTLAVFGLPTVALSFSPQSIRAYPVDRLYSPLSPVGTCDLCRSSKASSVAFCLLYVPSPFILLAVVHGRSTGAPCAVLEWLPSHQLPQRTTPCVATMGSLPSFAITRPWLCAVSR